MSEAPIDLCYDPEIVGPWVYPRVGGVYIKGAATAIGLLKNNELIAGVLYDNYTGQSVCAHIAGTPGTNWMTRAFLHAIFAYPFDELKVHKILGFVDSTNLPARRLNRHFGFILEATIEKAAPDGDLLIYSLANQDWQARNKGRYGKSKAASTARLSKAGR